MDFTLPEVQTLLAYIDIERLKYIQLVKYDPGAWDRMQLLQAIYKKLGDRAYKLKQVKE